MPDATPEEIALCPSGEGSLLPPTEHPVAPGIFRRLQHLGLVLWVSLSMPIVGSIYYLVGGAPPTTTMQQHYRLLAGLVTETTSLMVLWYVMSRQGKTRDEIGWRPAFADVPRAVGLFITAMVGSYLFLLPIQYSYRAYSGHFLAPKSLHVLFGFGVSWLSIAFVCLNPFFEELIVRAYTMSEVMSLGGSRVLAVAVSVVAQVSYHLYQGLENVLAVTFIFTVFSIYYVKTRRIAPVILVHLCIDLLSLLRGAL